MITTRIRGLLASLAILLLLIGAPAAMLRLGAIPTLHDFTWRDLLRQDDGTLALQVITAAAWIAWAWFAFAILLEIVAQFRGVRAPRLPGLPQVSAGKLVAAAAMLFIAVPATTPTVAPARAEAAPPLPDPPAQIPAAAPVETAPTPPATQPTDVAPTVSYTVKRGDSLWRIAERHLGAGSRFPEIIDLNPAALDHNADFLPIGLVLQLPATDAQHSEGKAYVVQPGDTLAEIAEDELHDPDRYDDIFEASRATPQPDGDYLTNPDLIRPGWTLTIPDPEAPANSPRLPDQAPDSKHQPQRPTPPTTSQQPTPTPSPSVPTHEPTRTSPRHVENHADEESEFSPSWLLPGLAGAGAILAGGLFLVLRRHHRTRRRYRLPGHENSPPSAELRPVQKTIHLEGTSTATLIERLDAALHMLPREEQPRLVAAELGNEQITLHLSIPTMLPHPWTGGPTIWTVPADVGPPPDGSHISPYPLLASIGQTDDGHLWLLNLEELGVINLTGDREHADALARHLAAELTVTPWSMLVQVDTHGIAGEFVGIDPDRLHHHDDTDFLADIATDLDPTGRLPGFDPDRYRAVLLAKDSDAINTITQTITADADRTGAAVVILDADPELNASTLTLTRSGHLNVSHPALRDVRIRAAGLTAEEAAVCAAIVEVTRDAEKCPMPRSETTDDHMAPFIDAAGALLPEYVHQRPPSDHEPAGQDSLLPESTERYVDKGATTSDDVHHLAPVIDSATRDTITALDSTLDDDIAEWNSPDSRLPKLTLLGPVHLRAYGAVPTARRPYFAELLAYLVLHPGGVRTSELLEAIGVSRSRLTIDLGKLRNWLGKNPRTGKDHLQDARKTPASKRLGHPAYEAEDILVDLDLFRRLRTRGEARGAEGIHDLYQALRLVTGEPFTQLRERGWSWLLDGQRHDHIAVSMIVDSAHLAVTRALAEHEYDLAREAAEIATRAAPYDDVPRLDFSRVLASTGHPGLAEELIADHIYDRDDGHGPVEPPSRSRRAAG